MVSGPVRFALGPEVSQRDQDLRRARTEEAAHEDSRPRWHILEYGGNDLDTWEQQSPTETARVWMT
jgi:hypothetical protein